MSSHALGIKVSADSLYAVLLERTEEGTTVQFQTSSTEGGMEDESLPFEGPDEAASGMEEESDDVTIQFGDDEGGGGDMFMGSEFDEFDGEDGGDGGNADAWNFQAELDRVLDECADRGYEDPEIAFCSTTSEIDDVELRMPPDEDEEEPQAEETERGLPLPASESTLLEMLEEQYEGKVEKERVGFVPMHRTGDGFQRVLALIARPGGSVLSTLDSMQDQTLARSPRTRLLDGEVSLYLGLVRSALQLPPDTPEKTIFVRAGAEDTLVLFIEGNTLRQSEHLPELTAEDSAETICSRVLLLQDEYGMGEVQHLVLIGEEDEEVLSSAFKSYFSTAEMHLLRSSLPGGEEVEAEAFVGATGAALRLLDDPEYEPYFQPVNMLAKKYIASRFRVPVGWAVPTLLTLLAVTTLGFVWLYFSNASTISERRSELQSLEAKLEKVDQQALQRRIDSLQSATTEYAEANEVIGQLLRGSNKWSRGLATVTGRMDSIQGLTIDQWSPENQAEVRVLGRSTDRSKIVQLAQDLEANILGLTFTETRDVSLYDFALTVPLDTTEPDAIAYWREQRGEQLAAGSDPIPTGPRESSSTVDSVEAQGPTVAQARSEADTTERGETATEAAAEGESSIWTVVVASVLESTAAEETAQRFRERLSDQDYPVQVQHSSQNGRYRVGVGQFSSVENALSVLNTMTGTLPDGAWLLKMPEAEAQTAPTEASVSNSTAADQSTSGRSG